MISGQIDSIDYIDSAASELDTTNYIDEKYEPYTENKIPLSPIILAPVIIDSNFYISFIEDTDYNYINEGSERNIIVDLWNQFLDFLANILRVSNKAGLSKLLKILLICLGIYLFVIAILKGTGISFFKKRDNDIPVVMKGLPQVKNEADLEQQLKEAVAANQYRKAIQLVYVKSLFYLSSQSKIKLQSAKTNRDYIAELDNDEAQEAFIVLTKEFEYVHYGDFEATEERFLNVTSLFESIKGQSK